MGLHVMSPNVYLWTKCVTESINVMTEQMNTTTVPQVTWVLVYFKLTTEYIIKLNFK